MPVMLADIMSDDLFRLTLWAVTATALASLALVVRDCPFDSRTMRALTFPPTRAILAMLLIGAGWEPLAVEVSGLAISETTRTTLIALVAAWLTAALFTGFVRKRA